MKVSLTPSEVATIAPNIIFVAGFFDGVHLGHRKLISHAKELATKENAQVWVLSFDPHPLHVIKPDKCPPLITSIDERLKKLEELALDGCLLIPFSHELASLSPEAFYKKTFVHWECKENSCIVLSGNNWRFGKNHSGKLSDIETFSKKQISTIEIEDFYYKNELISSSRIRKAIIEGNLSEANEMLGYPFSITDKTIAGRGVGTQMGFATANIATLPNHIYPPVGVYEVSVLVEGQKYKGLANLGYRPTFTNARPKLPELEVHILNFNQDLHDKTLSVSFIKKIREEKKFNSKEELVQQIKKDVESII